MRNAPDRAIFSVVRHESGWAVEHDGEVLDITPDKDIAKAAANKHARAAHDGGTPCLVRVVGETGFFNAA